ncbi:hypothetical protein HMPREF9093_01076 [Fusobacterium sp. oral taxon 370 str. F0437]|uniref:META domain-containing protein n=1 Tax=Fusobacterium sp. oral taxon 370 TaxID=712288 RepID=UPI000234AAEB|nr:META domain-containing protein [Fusobacterium sp. oral taxon 370]EHI78684.1 hypothetical protein HMPREF9093_01076 [Fusobacterium sp. oral taxon 370 str. F0437]
MKKLLILGIAALALTACTDTKVPFLSSKSGNTNSSSNASGTSVGLFANLKEQLNGREFIIVTEGYNSKTSIGFKGNRVYGFSGINRYFGTYQVSGGKFIFSEFGLTRMAGSEKEMTQELKFLDILKNNKSVKLSEDTLTLISTEGIELIFKDPKAAVTQSK